MSIPRVALAVILAMAAIYIAMARPSASLPALLPYLTAIVLFGMAAAVLLLPRRFGGFLLMLALIPPAAWLLTYEQSGTSWKLIGVIFLVLAGAGLRGLVRLTPDHVEGDLHSSDPAHRARGISNLGFLFTDQHGPALEACQGLLEKALTDPDQAVRERAEALQARLAARSANPLDALDDLAADALAEEALAEDPEAALEGELPQPPPNVADLIAVLKGGAPGPCRTAVDTLVAIGAPAISALEAAADEGDPDLRVDALRALELIRGPADA
jgi:hypothetical protein